MSTASHLDEFRKRLASSTALVVCFMKSRLAGHRADGARQELSVRLYLTDRVDHVLCAHRHDRGVIAVPVIIYEIWRFIQRDLRSRNRKWTLIVLALGLLLFCLGAVFSFKIACLIVLGQSPSADQRTIQAMVLIENYISFMVTSSLTFGVVFELPIVTGPRRWES